MFRGGLETAGIVAAVEVGSDFETGLGPGSARVIENLLVRVEGFARPVSRDFREEAMLDGIPFGSTCRIVSNRDGERKGVGQLRLDFGFPGVTPATVAAAGIGEDQQLA